MQAALAAEHGLATRGVDGGRLAEALARSRALMMAGEANPHRLAAAYCTGLLRARPFGDASAALALAVAYSVLRTGGVRLTAPEAEAVAVIRAVAAGEIHEVDLESWLERNSAPA